MRLPSASEVLITASSLLSAANANPFPQTYNDLAERAFSNSPTGGYAPGKATCPNSLLRGANDISDGEKSFLKTRKPITDKALIDFLNRASMVDFDVGSFMSAYSPKIGIAFSGGGYRAMLSGAGELAAFDSRTAGSTQAGNVGGLLQSATYVAGLSGGSWLLGSVVINNFTTIAKLQASGSVWDLTHSILAPEGALHIVDTAKYYSDMKKEVTAKEKAGFDVSLTDYWSRALSRQFVNVTDGGPGVTFSSIALTDAYKNAEMPFPIIIADGRDPGQLIISSNATIYEFNPLEFGSFDRTLYAFAPMEYIGSNVTNGKPNEDGKCIRGFDNAGFVMGTSSSLFNSLLLQLNSTGVSGILKNIAESVLDGLSESETDIADYSPNPFFGVNPDINPSAKTRDLTLVDGGMDLQNIPLHPLIQPVRKLDVIFAMDNSADTVRQDGSLSNWPNGTAMVATYERSLSKQSNGTLFPSVPDVNTFVNLGLNNRPTFFGCNGSNITTEASKVPPLIVYIPNSPYTYKSNKSTTDMAYSARDRDLMIENGYNIATRGNGTSAQNWPACIGCAIVRRQEERTGATQTAQCKKCFTDYCWDGTLAPVINEDYNPKVQIANKGAGGKIESWITGVVVVAGLVSAFIVV